MPKIITAEPDFTVRPSDLLARVLAIIPARGGSKGLLRKNLRKIGGVPLIGHSIQAALLSRSIDEVVVSTEDSEIAAIARSFGVTVIDRPACLATDTVQNTDVVRHALESAGGPYSHVTLLQPTSPLRRASHIDDCLKPLINGKARSVMTVTAVEHHPGKALFLNASNEVSPFTTTSDMEARRQDLPVVYRQNGAVYALAVSDFLSENKFILAPCRASIMPQNCSIDIDSEFDLLLAENLLAWTKNHDQSKTE
jgi:CMP-N,N'-diacetyllegionaminic acid synthase